MRHSFLDAIMERSFDKTRRLPVNITIDEINPPFWELVQTALANLQQMLQVRLSSFQDPIQLIHHGLVVNEEYN